MQEAFDRLITVAIHTYDHALCLKNILESQNIPVTLQNINLDHPVVAAGVRVRIKESDLPQALRIIENPEIFSLSSSVCQQERLVLVPVDFSSYSMQACRLAFAVASIHKATITLLHTFTDPTYESAMQMSDSLTYEVEDAESRQIFQTEAESLMEKFVAKLREEIKNGGLPPVIFNFETCEGLPEEAINQYAKEHKPMLIVMGTRGADKKERDLVGSVTAEVLDTCRFPVFTIPEGVDISNISDIKRMVYFCDIDQADIIALDRLRSLLSGCSPRITLVKIPSKKQNRDNTALPLAALKQYCEEHYPGVTFDTDYLMPDSAEADFERITDRQHIDLIAVPNKKKNVFARLFNPGIAHRLLFRTDSPMIVIPV